MQNSRAYAAAIEDPRIPLAIRAHEQRIGRQIVAQFPFAYVVDLGTMAGAGSTVVQSLQIQSDADFLMERICGYVYDNAGASNQNATLRRNVGLQITEQASQNNMFQDFVTLFDVAGDANSATTFLTTDPTVFMISSSISVQLVNNTTLTLVNNQITLIGRKLVRG